MSVFGLQEPESPTALREPVSRMQLLFDEEEEEEDGREADADRAGGPLEPEEAAPQQSGWELGQNPR